MKRVKTKSKRIETLRKDGYNSGSGSLYAIIRDTLPDDTKSYRVVITTRFILPSGKKQAYQATFYAPTTQKAYSLFNRVEELPCMMLELTD